MLKVCDLCNKTEPCEPGKHDIKMSRKYKNVLYCGACRMAHHDGIQPGTTTQKWIAALIREGHTPRPVNELGLYEL